MLSFTDKGWSQYSDWEDENPKTHKKIKNLSKAFHAMAQCKAKVSPKN